VQLPRNFYDDRLFESERSENVISIMDNPEIR
jgi:hypothetical protein